MRHARAGGKSNPSPRADGRDGAGATLGLAGGRCAEYSGPVQKGLKESAVDVTAAQGEKVAPLPPRAAAEDDGAGIDRALAGALRVGILASLGADRADRARFALGMAEVATVLWTRFLKFDSADPHWPDRDRVVLADEDAGLLRAALDTLTGQAIQHARAEQDERLVLSGAGGRGLAIAVGLALAERILASRFGRSLVDHRTWVIASAEEVISGAWHEAASLAGALKLSRITVLAEAAAWAPDRRGDPADSDEVLRCFAAHGWATRGIEADDPDQVAAALAYAVRAARPTLILCRTGGSPWQAAAGDEDGVPPDLARAWAEAARRGARERLGWRRRHQRSPLRDEFDRALLGRLPEAWRFGLDAWKAQLAADRSSMATAEASRQALAILAAAIPELIDLSDGSGAVRAPSNGAASPSGTRGGVPIPTRGRRQALASAISGLAAHGGAIPVGSTALARADCLRPALRLAARLRRRVIHVLSEDGTGSAAADGAIAGASTGHDHLAALRAIPNLFVFRPADAVELAEAWALAASRDDGPSVLAVSEEVVPAVRTSPVAENLSARGGYVLAEADGPRQATLIASGAEVAVALAARDLLQAHGVAVAVVSLPCFELFAAQDEAWRALVLGGVLRVGIECGIAQGWERWLGLSGLFIGPETVSPPSHAAGSSLQRPTPEGVAQAVLRRLS